MKKTKHQELQKLVDSGINLSSLGLELCDMTEDERYFCTPERAEVFGRVGVDGIHFCFAGGHGDMVFCVCPMDLAPEVCSSGRKELRGFSVSACVLRRYECH